MRGLSDSLMVDLMGVGFSEFYPSCTLKTQYIECVYVYCSQCRGYSFVLTQFAVIFLRQSSVVAKIIIIFPFLLNIILYVAALSSGI